MRAGQKTAAAALFAALAVACTLAVVWSVVWAAGAGLGQHAAHGGGHDARAASAHPQAPPALTAGAPVTVTVGDIFFSPDRVEIEVGGTVVWVRESGFHNVVADDDSFTSGPVSNTWTTFAHTFTTTGEFGYYCEAHGGLGFGMRGTVVVRAAAPAQTLYLPALIR